MAANAPCHTLRNQSTRLDQLTRLSWLVVLENGAGRPVSNNTKPSDATIPVHTTERTNKFWGRWRYRIPSSATRPAQAIGQADKNRAVASNIVWFRHEQLCVGAITSNHSRPINTISIITTIPKRRRLSYTHTFSSRYMRS